MNINQTKEYIEKELVVKIRDKMTDITYFAPKDSVEKFTIIKELSQLITELLSNDENKNKFIKLANSSGIKENSEDNKIKYRTFEIIRHIVSHFPFFEKWDDVFVTKNMLNWDGRGYTGIKSFFEKNKGKILTYTVYTKIDDKWLPTHPVTMEILPLDDEKPTYMKDMISEDDVIWTFSLIDHYLDSMGYGLETYSCVSL